MLSQNDINKRILTKITVYLFVEKCFCLFNKLAIKCLVLSEGIMWLSCISFHNVNALSVSLLEPVKKNEH